MTVRFGMLFLPFSRIIKRSEFEALQWWADDIILEVGLIYVGHVRCIYPIK